MQGHMELLRLQDERKAAEAKAALLPQGPLPQDPLRAKARANELFTKGETKLAAAAYEHAIARCDADPASIAAADAALGATPTKAVLFANLAACHVQLGRWEEALSAADAALKEASGYVKAAFRRAQALRGLRRYPEVIEAIASARALTDDPKAIKQLSSLEDQATKDLASREQELLRADKDRVGIQLLPLGSDA